MSQFGDTLKALLHERDMPQAELARRIGITAQAVSTWISGNVTPTHANVTLIEDELAVEPRGLLLAAAGYRTDDQDDTPTVESLIRADPGFDPEDKRVILRIIRMARDRHAQAQ